MTLSQHFAPEVIHPPPNRGRVTGKTDREKTGKRLDSKTSEQLRNVVAEQLGLDRSEIVPEARILDDLGADSLDIVELVMALEESFDIEVPDADVEMLQTIGDVVAYVEKKQPLR